MYNLQEFANEIFNQPPRAAEHPNEAIARIAVKTAVEPVIADPRDKGACKGLDATIFYPDNNDETEAAVAICQECLVVQECLDYAMEKREEFGILGGKTQTQRKRIATQRRALGS